MPSYSAAVVHYCLIDGIVHFVNVLLIGRRI
jgi:hypothetical protein